VVVKKRMKVSRLSGAERAGIPVPDPYPRVYTGRVGYMLHGYGSSKTVTGILLV